MNEWKIHVRDESFWGFHLQLAATPSPMYRARPKSNPLGKFDISGIVADFFHKFTVFTEKDSCHIFYKFY